MDDRSHQTHKVSKEEVNIGNRTERALAFLDTWSANNEDGSINAKVYHKETHKDQYLHFSSNHELDHKGGVVKTLKHYSQ